MHEHVGAARRLDRAGARPRVAGHHHRPPPAARLDHLLRPHHASVRERHRLAALERAVGGAHRYAQRGGLLRVEAAGPLVLDERPADRRRPVLGRERAHAAAVAPDLHARADLVDADVEREPLGPGEEHDVEEPLRRARAVDVHGRRAALHRERAQEPDRAEVVIGVEVREEDRVHVEARAEADHLPLRSLSAVDEEQLPFAAHREAGEVPVDGRLGRRGAEEGETEHRGWNVTEGRAPRAGFDDAPARMEPAAALAACPRPSTAGPMSRCLRRPDGER